MIYLLTFVLLLIPAIRFDLMRIDGSKAVWLVVEFVWLVLLAGLRYRVGGDTLSYMAAFEICPRLDELSTYDYETAEWNPLWYAFTAVFRSFGNSFTLLQVVHAAILNAAVFRFFRKYCGTCVFSAILFYFIGYFCYFNMEVLRESLCIAIFLTAYPLIEKKRYLLYYAVVVFAVFIHTSALIMAVFPLARLFKKDNFWLTTLIVAGVVFVFKVVDIVTMILYSTFDGATAEKIRGYTLEGESNVAGVLVLMLSFLPYMTIMYVRNINGYTKRSDFGVLMYFVILFQATSFFLAFAARFSNYLVLFGVVYILETFYTYYWDFHYRSFSRLLMNGAVVAMVVSMGYFYVKSKNSGLAGAHVYHRYIPYHSVFDQESDTRRERLLMNERADE